MTVELTARVGSFAFGSDMPFKSAKQRGWMFKNKPEIAKRWASKYGSKIRRGKKSKK